MPFFDFLKSAPERAPLDLAPEQLHSTYRYWRIRIMYTTIIGYALFYFVRKNLSLAMPGMEADLGITKSDLGLFLTLHGVVYGISKFANGFVGDRANPRYLMAMGLAASALMNVFFGLSSAVWTLGLFWLFNGWFQGMGFPPCARSLTCWFPAKERGTRFAIWNTSHSIGAGLVMLLNSFLVLYHWRLCLLVPALLALLGAVFVVLRLRDAPQSLGLPSPEAYCGDEPEEVSRGHERDEADFKRFVRRHVFANPAIWLVSLANFFLYTVRYAIVDWGPTFLKEMKGCELQHAGWMVAGYEIFGIVGMLVSGWLMDKVFQGRGGRACLVYMAACTVCILLFWKLSIASILLNGLLLCLVGFFIYGPQCLVGVMAANLATKRAAATAIGFTGFFGYLSGVLSGWGLGMIVEKSGWHAGFAVLTLAGAAATVLFAFCWNTK
jgi:OPA family glycerol-3-phosphate transporter-like MFS transporter/OPA family sugar phosphate sensor protein UhpC-like MFS transporter